MNQSNYLSTPECISINEYKNRIEFIYKQISATDYLIDPPQPVESKIFKIVFSCVGGKWNRSKPIYGKIVPAQDECYEFDK